MLTERRAGTGDEEESYISSCQLKISQQMKCAREKMLRGTAIAGCLTRKPKAHGPQNLPTASATSSSWTGFSVRGVFPISALSYFLFSGEHDSAALQGQAELKLEA